MSEYQKIKVEHKHDGQILYLTLNAPKGNVMDGQMMAELTSALRESGRSAGVKAIVFTGAGAHFSFGASVPEHRKEQVGEMLATFHQLFRTLMALNKPMAALVRGQCLGGGMELAAFCHWIFAAEDAAFGQPEIRLAVIPPIAALVLPYRVGQSAADDLVLTGRSITAAEAEKLGLVHSISADPEQQLEEFLEKEILPKSGIALQMAVRASRFDMYRMVAAQIDDLEKMYLQELMGTEDANEGIAAFMEKRTPVWHNR